MAQSKSRPSGVVAVAVLMVWSGMLTIASIIPPIGPADIPTWAMVLDVVLGVVMLLIAWGLFTLRSWAYIVTIGIQAVNGLFGIVSVFAMPTAWPAWIAIAISAIVIVYLTRPRVREAFGMAGVL